MLSAKQNNKSYSNIKQYHLSKEDFFIIKIWEEKTSCKKGEREEQEFLPETEVKHWQVFYKLYYVLVSMHINFGI